MSTVAAVVPSQMQRKAGSVESAGDAHDFLLFCPSGSDANGVKNAIHALYYLPKQYKLVVGKDSSLIDGNTMTEGDDYLTDRIMFETNAESAEEASPLSYANAVICGDADVAYAEGDAPHIVVSDSAEANIEDNGRNGFTVAAGNPEALASAAIMIARGHYAMA